MHAACRHPGTSHCVLARIARRAAVWFVVVVGPARDFDARTNHAAGEDGLGERESEPVLGGSDLLQLERSHAAPDQPLQPLGAATERTPTAIGQATPHGALVAPHHARDATLQAAAKWVARALPTAADLLKRHPEDLG